MVGKGISFWGPAYFQVRTVSFRILELHPWSFSQRVKHPEKMLGKEDDPASYWVSVTFQGRTVKLREGKHNPLFEVFNPIFFFEIIIMGT